MAFRIQRGKTRASFWPVTASLWGMEEARRLEQEMSRIATICAHEGSNVELVQAEIVRRREATGMLPSSVVQSIYDDLVTGRWYP